MSKTCSFSRERILSNFVTHERMVVSIMCAKASSWLIGLALILAPSFLLETPTIASPQTPAAITDSVEGLKSQMEAILDAAKKKDSRHYEDLIDNLKVPEGANWFSATFGEEAGARVADNYGNSWAAYRDQISRILREPGKLRPKRVFVKQFSSASLPEDGFLQAVIKNARGSGVFYTAGTGKDAENDVLPGFYVYVQGGFRILNWGAFNGLPGVKPMRIRLGTSMAVRQLLYQVNPKMNEDARKQRAQGTVVLHILIGRDGDVLQLQPVSGPEMLMQVAMDAVRQWRFRPTLLNGDPVEVDTTISIVFSLDQ